MGFFKSKKFTAFIIGLIALSLTEFLGVLGLIQFRGRFDYAARAAPRRSNSAGLIWPRVECRRCWL